MEGREAWLAWLFCLELLWFLMKLGFLFEKTTFFFNRWNYVVSGTQISGEYSLSCNSVANLLVELFME